MIEAFHAYINSSEVLVRRQSGWGRGKTITHIGRWPWESDDVGSLKFDQFGSQSGLLGRWATLSVYLGSACCKFMAIDLPPEVKKAEELRLIAASQMQHQFGLSNADWYFCVDATSAPLGRSIACAIRADMMERIKQLSIEKRLRLISLQPYIASIWNAFEQQCDDSRPTALLSIENDALTVFMSTQKNLSSVHTFVHANNPQVIDREIKRLGATLEGDPAKHIYIARSKQMDQLDFTSRGVGVSGKFSDSNQLAVDFSDLLLSQASGATA